MVNNILTLFLTVQHTLTKLSEVVVTYFRQNNQHLTFNLMSLFYERGESTNGGSQDTVFHFS